MISVSAVIERIVTCEHDMSVERRAGVGGAVAEFSQLLGAWAPSGAMNAPNS